MISQTLLIVMLVSAAILAAYAICWCNPIPFSDLVAITMSDVLLWASALLYASGNVVAEEFVIATTEVAGSVTTYTYQLMQAPVTDVMFAALLLIAAVCMSVYSLYLIVPTIQEILGGDEEVTNV